MGGRERGIKEEEKMRGRGERRVERRDMRGSRRERGGSSSRLHLTLRRTLP